jgi:hypothetical protein
LNDRIISNINNDNETFIINRTTLLFPSFIYKIYIYIDTTELTSASLIKHNDRHISMISRICVCIIIIEFLLAAATINMVVIPASSSQLTARDFEEVRDNLVEVRLALQKGDLIEALQHLNNADEQLLLLAANATASTTDTNSTIS